jgi:hypothetical protein
MGGFYHRDFGATSSAQTPTMKLGPLQTLSFYLSSALRAEQVIH